MSSAEKAAKYHLDRAAEILGRLKDSKDSETREFARTALASLKKRLNGQPT